MNEQGPRTVLCTIASGPHRELFELARPSFEVFSALHGYELFVSHDDLGAGRPPAWGKVVLLRKLLDSYDRVVWVDSDAVIVNPSADIFVGLSRWTPLGLVVHRYGGLEVPNAGVMAILSCRWAKRFLDRVWAAERFVNHKWWDNAAVIELLGYDVSSPQRSTRRQTLNRRRVRELDLAWNSIPGDCSGDPRIVHFPGMSQAERLAGMRLAATKWPSRPFG